MAKGRNLSNFLVSRDLAILYSDLILDTCSIAYIQDIAKSRVAYIHVLLARWSGESALASGGREAIRRGEIQK
jgi:hypothetical protein